VQAIDEQVSQASWAGAGWRQHHHARPVWRISTTKLAAAAAAFVTYCDLPRSFGRMVSLRLQPTGERSRQEIPGRRPAPGLGQLLSGDETDCTPDVDQKHWPVFRALAQSTIEGSGEQANEEEGDEAQRQNGCSFRGNRPSFAGDAIDGCHGRDIYSYFSDCAPRLYASAVGE
jgi:hypothetical protein